MGRVEVRLPAGISLDLDVTVDMGRMVTGRPLAGQRTERSFRGTLGTGAPEGQLSIRAGTGEVRIR